MLSGGQRKRVGLAQVLICDPKILLMDEPFGPLDAQTRQIMGNLLLDLWTADRKAVLFVTHDLEEAIALSDRVVIMVADGPLIAQIKVLHSKEASAALRKRVLTHLASERHPELTDIRIIRESGDLDSAMPRFVSAFLESRLGNG